MRVPVDAHGRMRPDRLPPLDDRTILCIQAGNVNTGASDPFTELVPAAPRRRRVGPRRRRLRSLAGRRTRGGRTWWAGVDTADSWSTDGHKWLNVPYDSGFAICRDPAPMVAAMSVAAAYLQASDRPEPYQFTPEMSRRARGVEVWAALRTLGRSGVADLVERCCGLATRCAEGLAAAGARGARTRWWPTRCSCRSATTTRRGEVVAAVQADGTCWCGATSGRAGPRCGSACRRG